MNKWKSALDNWYYQQGLDMREDLCLVSLEIAFKAGFESGQKELVAERDALRVALEDELNWHETQDKVLSKQPDAYTGHNWGRWIQHQEHAAVIRAALGQGQEGS